MKFHPEQRDGGERGLTPALRAVLEQLRAQDEFCPEAYAHEKARRLNAYLQAHRLSSCVVAVSGGIDSALVLSLVARARSLPGAALKRVVPVLLPVFDPHAATNQDVATERGRELCATLGLEPVVVDLTRAHATTKALVDEAAGFSGGDWAAGQLVAYQRTPALYYLTALLNEQGAPGILVGTTNYDEGAYLGYFGKASDGLVDLQLISELHKHRVFQVAAHLGVPQSILKAIPTGDMFDGRVDEEVFGASYDFVELFLRHKRVPERVNALLTNLDAASQARYASLAQVLEQMHRYNAHKYLGASVAIHLDLWDWSFEGSWRYRNWVGSSRAEKP